MVCWVGLRVTAIRVGWRVGVSSWPAINAITGEKSSRNVSARAFSLLSQDSPSQGRYLWTALPDQERQ